MTDNYRQTDLYNQGAAPVKENVKKNNVSDCHKKLLLASIQRDRHLLDEYVALYVGIHNKELENKFRETTGRAQSDEVSSLAKSGDMDTFAVRNLQAFFKNNENAIGFCQTADQAALLSDVLLGTEAKHYEDSYLALKTWIDQSLDEVKPELYRVLFPVFVQLFLSMVLKKFTEDALSFFKKYEREFFNDNREDILKLQTVQDHNSLKDPDISKFLKHKFFVKMSRQSYQLLKHQVDFSSLVLVTKIMNLNINFHIVAETDIVLDQMNQSSILVQEDIIAQADQSKGVMSNAQAAKDSLSFFNDKELNLGRLRLFYPEFQELEMQSIQQQNSTNEQNAESGQPGFAPSAQPAQSQQDGLNLAKRLKKCRARLIEKVTIPLPDLDRELENHIQSEYRQRAILGNEKLPTIGTISLLNTYRQVNCSALSESGDIMATGMADSTIKITWLNKEALKRSLSLDVKIDQPSASQPQSKAKGAVVAPQPVQVPSYTVLSEEGLKIQLLAKKTIQEGKTGMNQTNQKAEVVKRVKHSEDDKKRLALDVRPDREEQKILKEKSEFVLIGHAGPVYSVAISIDDKFIISGSQDCSIRRWSMQTRSCLVVYQAHTFPVWDVKFSPLGYYFASASNDRTACIWNMKKHMPVRILVGHMCDVEVIEFHPNGHYVATGSSDRQVRLWSVETGECVRLFFTISGVITSMRFLRGGSHLVCGNEKGQMVIFDVERGQPVDIIQTCQRQAIYSIDTSQDDSLLAVGTELGTIELYSIPKLVSLDADNWANILLKAQHNKGQTDHALSINRSTSKAFVRCYHSKLNGVQLVKFSWRNFLTTIGCVEKHYQ